MGFKYSSVITKPNADVKFFSEAYPSEFNTLIDWWKSQPGYVSGSGKWNVNPDNPNEFLIEHTWDSRESWLSAAKLAQSLNEAKISNQHSLDNNIYAMKSLSDF